VVLPVESGLGVHQMPDAATGARDHASGLTVVPAVDVEAVLAPSRRARVRVPPARGDAHAAVELLTGLRRSRRRQGADPEQVNRTGDCGAHGEGSLGADGPVCADRR
jgi:hypothetical protein